MTDWEAFARRYIAMWNESDATRRAAAVRELFAPDAAHYTPSREVRGHTAMEERVATAYETWVRPGKHVFRAVPGADGHHGAVRFNWEMAVVATGEVDSVGFDFIVVDAEGRIVSDHQFIDR